MTKNIPCYVCVDETAELNNDLVVDCPRCGKYFFTEPSAEIFLSGIPKDDQRRVTISWMDF